jgi:hypothetical protein
MMKMDQRTAPPHAREIKVAPILSPGRPQGNAPTLNEWLPAIPTGRGVHAEKKKFVMKLQVAYLP